MKNTFEISNYLTQTTILKMQVAFERNEVIIMHSNTKKFYLRKSIQGEQPVTQLRPESIPRLVEAAITQVDYKNNLLTFQNFAGDTVGLVRISDYSPYVGDNGNWYSWSDERLEYVNTGICAEGMQGEQGEQGPQGEWGEKGDSGNIDPIHASMVHFEPFEDIFSDDLQNAVMEVKYSITDAINLHNIMDTAHPYQNIHFPGVNTVSQALDSIGKGIGRRADSCNGSNLSDKFYDELDKDMTIWDLIWDLIKNRIQTGNFEDIFIGDYIPFLTGGNIIIAEVAGIDTRSSWWLHSARGNSGHFANVHGNGHAAAYLATSDYRVPIYFRVA